MVENNNDRKPCTEERLALWLRLRRSGFDSQPCVAVDQACVLSGHWFHICKRGSDPFSGWPVTVQCKLVGRGTVCSEPSIMKPELG